MREFYRRLTVLPWTTVISGLAFISGLVGLLHVGTTTDALNAELNHTLVTALQVGYMLAGASMFVGLGKGSAAIEGFGAVMLSTSIIVRLIAVLSAVGLVADTTVLFVFYLLIVWACLTRLRSLYRGDVLIRTKGSRESDPE